MNIPGLDLAIIIFYLLAILVLGVLSTRGTVLTGEVYFLAGRSLRWPTVGAALFASNISTIHLVGLFASGYNEGLVWGNFEWMAVITIVILAIVFAPFYYRTQISTLPEFLERRYSPGCRTILAFMGIVGALFIHVGMSLYAGAVVFQQFFGIDVRVSIFIVAVIVSIYTVAGGLRAVVVTETVQSVILLAGAVIITISAVLALPEHGIRTWADFQESVKPNQLSMIQSDSTVGLNWYAVLLGFPVMGVWYWCTDQTIVQRVLGARSERDAQIGALFAGALKILPVFILVFPGVIGYVLFRDLIGADGNQTLPVMINELVPTGLKGLITAAILAALMSTVSAALNSSGTLVAVDIVKRLRPRTSDQRQILVGRISAVVVMVLATLWSTQGGRYSSIFEAINAIASNLAPPITTVFLLGIFWRRGTQQAALWTLIFGFAMGAVAFIVDLPVFGTIKLLTDGYGIPFMMQAWWGFCICALFYITVSLLTPPPRPEQLDGLTWSHPLAPLTDRALSGISDPRVLAGLLLVTIATLYYSLA